MAPGLKMKPKNTISCRKKIDVLGEMVPAE